MHCLYSTLHFPKPCHVSFGNHIALAVRKPNSPCRSADFYPELILKAYMSGKAQWIIATIGWMYTYINVLPIHILTTTLGSSRFPQIAVQETRLVKGPGLDLPPSPPRSCWIRVLLSVICRLCSQVLGFFSFDSCHLLSFLINLSLSLSFLICKIGGS